MIFLLRARVWPASGDYWVFIALGLNSAVIGYCLSQGYRLADAATAAPFEYVLLPLSVFCGHMIFDNLPNWEVWVGIALILSSGLFVFLRERQKARLGTHQDQNQALVRANLDHHFACRLATAKQV